MNWKAFTAASISSLFLTCFPYNIIGCAGGDPDPYDYFVSFYHKQLAGSKAHEPFFYTNFQFLYDAAEPVNTAEATSAEWVDYGNKAFSRKEAYAFMCEYSRKDLSVLYMHLEKNQPLSIPDSVKQNAMTGYFMKSKDLEALGYVLYAKQLEPLVTGSWSSWEPVERDSVKMSKLIRNGQQLWAAAKSDYIKLRYAYQVTRLAHYSGDYMGCLELYNQYVAPNKTSSVLQELGTGLYAGAQFRLGKKEEAAYTYSKLFSHSDLKKVSNYLSFDWCVKRLDERSRKNALALCKTDEERAHMLALFALGSNEPEPAVLEAVFKSIPKAPVLQVLLTREVHKLEEFLLTPGLQFENGKEEARIFYTEYTKGDDNYNRWMTDCNQLIRFCQSAAAQQSDKVPFLLAAAHAAVITRQSALAKELLEAAKKETQTSLQKDQWAMTNLLQTINTTSVPDAAFEAALLPSLQWMEKKAAADKEFARFYRRLFGDVLAVKYNNAPENLRFKSKLCYGLADAIQAKYLQDGWGYYSNALQILRQESTPREVEQLIALMESKKPSAYDQFLISRNSFSRNDINDLAGTAWLRQYKFREAEKWLAKVPASYYAVEPFKTYLAANPFADLLLDTHAPTKQDTVKYTKLGFSRKMIALEKQFAAQADKELKAKLAYEMAKGYYHMSYWGNSWLLVQYSWSSGEAGEDAYMSDSKAAAPRGVNLDYYTVRMARDWYSKAEKLSANKNFQARCVYMQAKCAQKEYSNIPWFYEYEQKTYQRELNKYLLDFDREFGYYSRMKQQYSNTPFYKEAYNTCSYLKDFLSVKK